MILHAALTQLPAATIQEDSYFFLQKEVEAVLCDTLVWDNVSTPMHWLFSHGGMQIL